MTETAAVASIPAGKASQVWLRALESTSSIARNPERLLSTVIAEVAERSGNAAALVADRESFTFGELADRSDRYTRWALQQGIRKGDVVALLMTSRPEYFACWSGIAAAGGIVALLNTNLIGSSLAHCIDVARPQHVIVTGEYRETLLSALNMATAEPAIWLHGVDDDRFPRIDAWLRELPSERLAEVERPRVTIGDLALYIYTSGTTGLPKAARVSHGRILQWCSWFAAMLGMQPEDRMYDCLPMYHSVGGVLAPGAALVAGASVAIRESFSAREFWADVVRWDCSMFQYIGEFCRYLLHAPAGRLDRSHRIRVACGNGMSADVWNEFRERFGIPAVFEFYASTEGGLSLFNVEGKPGSIGRVPPYLAHRLAPVLVRFDPETELPYRDVQGFCIPCAPNEAGEALARGSSETSPTGSRYEGYTDPQASEQKLLRNVFEPGDMWVRTGDLMRRDEKGFFYYVDRVGDTFRWKGENVATTEVAEILCGFPGVKHAVVYGVKVPGAEGRVGMAALTVEGRPELARLREYMAASLASYARPAFLRFRENCDVTGTFKYSKAELVKQGYNPEVMSDALYFDNPETQTLRSLDRSIYDRIQAGNVRL
ncbi:MAG TPA: long-chain-acyl-CoA synthetase [Acidobacteriaceae bacterium]|jgi:fatty-acyl-CoA synthase|nr:long-chain-acyl-CoA synthetase [Acidobacteriaceae bacterium]